jgi:hypothetical protein
MPEHFITSTSTRQVPGHRAVDLLLAICAVDLLLVLVICTIGLLLAPCTAGLILVICAVGLLLAFGAVGIVLVICAASLLMAIFAVGLRVAIGAVGLLMAICAVGPLLSTGHLRSWSSSLRAGWSTFSHLRSWSTSESVLRDVSRRKQVPALLRNRGHSALSLAISSRFLKQNPNYCAQWHVSEYVLCLSEQLGLLLSTLHNFLPQEGCLYIRLSRGPVCFRYLR